MFGVDTSLQALVDKQLVRSSATPDNLVSLVESSCNIVDPPKVSSDVQGGFEVSSYRQAEFLPVLCSLKTFPDSDSHDLATSGPTHPSNKPIK